MSQNQKVKMKNIYQVNAVEIDHILSLQKIKPENVQIVLLEAYLLDLQVDQEVDHEVVILRS